MSDNQSRLIGEQDGDSVPHHVSSVNWVSATTTLTIEPVAPYRNIITRLGFVAHNVTDDFAETIKIEHYDKPDWIELLSASNYAEIVGVASRIDSFKVGAKNSLAALWHFRNVYTLRGLSEQKVRIYPSGLITNCDSFYCSVRYMELI
jgi:hypothetical protein